MYGLLVSYHIQEQEHSKHMFMRVLHMDFLDNYILEQC